MESSVVYFAVFLLQFGRNTEGYEVGAPCNYDNDCFIENAYCRNQRVCDCKRNFRPSEDRQLCIAAVGAVCESKYDCSTLEHSDCQQNVCDCEPNFVPDPKGNACLPRTLNIKGNCQQDIQCKASFGDLSYCQNGVCTCLPQNHFSSGRCYKTRGLDEACQTNNDCYMGDAFIHRVNCQSGFCRCVIGFTKGYDNKCQKSSAHTNEPPSFYTLLVIFAGAFGLIRKLTIKGL